jgi:hypothetical protein
MSGTVSVRNNQSRFDTQDSVPMCLLDDLTCPLSVCLTDNLSRPLSLCRNVLFAHVSQMWLWLQRFKHLGLAIIKSNFFSPLTLSGFHLFLLILLICHPLYFSINHPHSLMCTSFIIELPTEQIQVGNIPLGNLITPKPQTFYHTPSLPPPAIRMWNGERRPYPSLTCQSMCDRVCVPMPMLMPMPMPKTLIWNSCHAMSFRGFAFQGGCYTRGTGCDVVYASLCEIKGR